MDIGGIREVRYGVADVTAASAWWTATLGAWAAEDAEPPGGGRVLEVGDGLHIVLVPGDRSVIAGFWASGEGAPPAGERMELSDPDGNAIALSGPPVWDEAARPEQERPITEFVERADDLPGPPVADLADAVASVVADAQRRIDELLAGVAPNKVLATQLLLGQRARAVAGGSTDQWRLSAASTLLSDQVIAGIQRDD